VSHAIASSYPPSPSSLARAVVAAALPAYLFPFVTAFPGGLLAGRPRLLLASVTTIPIPSAIAAISVVLVAHALRGRLPGEARVSRPTAFAFGFVACGLLGLLVIGALVRLGALASDAYGYACPSAAIGGGMSALAWARGRQRTQRAGGSPKGIVAALLALTTIAGCAAPRPRISPLHARDVAAEWPLPPAGVSLETWETYRSINAVCVEWANSAAQVAGHHQGRARTSGAVAAIAGVLGSASGIAGGILAGRADSDGDQDEAIRISKIGGLTALGLGTVASVAGIYSGIQGGNSGASMNVALKLEQTLRQHLAAVLAVAENRDQAAAEQGTSLALECARWARRVPALESLPLSSAAPARFASALLTWRTLSGRDPVERSAQRSLQELLFSRSAP
jgi:hypothetical protein